MSVSSALTSISNTSDTRSECFIYDRKQAIDEGGSRLFANVEDRSYIPGKPHPNCAEYIVAVGDDMWATNLVWRKDIGGKYGFPEKKLPQMEVFLDYHFSKHPYSGIQPYIFYIDTRGGSFALMEKIRDARCYGVLSLSSTAKPKALMMWMRTDLGVKDWWSVGYPSLTANLITIHTKKKTFLNILTNWAPLHSETVTYRKRKSLKESIQSSFCCSEGI